MNAPGPNCFDLENAAALCEASRDAYAPGQPHALYHAASDTRAVLSTIDNDLVVAFRGTRSLANFVTDFSCARAPLFPGSRVEVHAGFQRAFEGIRAQLSESVTGLLSGRRDLRIWFTGHSLGGALAKLAALHFASPWTSVYTFGEPRVGNAAFRDLYNGQLGARTFRVIHADDIVPRVPWLLGAYRHSGHEVFYVSAAASGVAALPHLFDPGVWRKLPFDLRNAARELRHGKIALLADHHVDTYCALFAKETVQGSISAPGLPAAVLSQ